MKPMSIAGALVGGVVGALIWAAISYFTNYEIGYVAWAVGGLVGVASLFAGGAGISNGILCGAVALGSILLGKYLGVTFALAPAMNSAIDEQASKMYAEFKKDATAFSALESEKQYRDFMVRRKYTPKKRVADITEEELDHFKENTVPMLQTMAEDEPSFEEWKESEQGQGLIESMEALMGAPDPMDLVGKGLSPIDLIFAFLGIATAFKVGAGSLRTVES